MKIPITKLFQTQFIVTQAEMHMVIYPTHRSLLSDMCTGGQTNNFVENQEQNTLVEHVRHFELSEC